MAEPWTFAGSSAAGRVWADGAGSGGGSMSDAEAAAKLAEQETLEEIAKIPVDEKKSRAKTMLDEMQAALRRANEILAEATQNNDVVQLNCITEKLNQITTLVTIGQTSESDMLAAIAKQNDTGINHEFAKLSIAHTKVLALRAEADQCVGEQAIYTGLTQITSENDANRNKKDPTETGLDFWPETTELASKF